MLVPGTILLVEDADSDAILIREAFRKARIVNPIVRVSSGKEALSYLEGKDAFADRAKHPSPDIVLLDLGLPDTSGFDVLDRIRSRKEAPQLPVVVVTGSENPTAQQEADKHGASAFFRKALQFEDLVEMVQRIGAEWSLSTAPRPSAWNRLT